MRLLVAIFLTVFLLSGCTSKDDFSYQLDKEATLNARWKVGSILTYKRGPQREELLVQFLGITTQGYYLAQDFYLGTGIDVKASEPYLITNIEDDSHTPDFKKIIGQYIAFYSNGTKYSEGQYKNGQKDGAWKYCILMEIR